MSQTTVRYACGPVNGATTPRRTPSSWPAGSTSARSTSTCDAWAYDSRRRGRSLTSSPKGIPAWGPVASKFRVVATLHPGHVSGWEYVAVGVIINVARRGGGPPRGCVDGPNRPAPWTCPSWGRLVMADPHGPAWRRITRWARDSVRGTRGILPDMIRKRPTRGLFVADVLGNTVDTMTPLYTTIYNYSPRGVTPNLPSCSPSSFTDAPTKVPRPRGRANLGGAAPAAPRGRRRGHAGVVDGGL